jgi:hypothetical protein
MLIKRHDTLDVVELTDGSAWHIWPGDSPTTLGWLPTTKIDVVELEDEVFSHVLVSRDRR